MSDTTATPGSRTFPLIVVTVVGRDRPGIIARTTGLLADLGMNLEDSSMTRLRGHFAMTLVCSGAADVAAVDQALAPMANGSLAITVQPVPTQDGADGTGQDGTGQDGTGQDGTGQGRTGDRAAPETWLVSVHGADRLGIVAEVAAVVAQHDGNITDLATRLSGELYVLTAEVDLPAGEGQRLGDALRRTAEELAVHVALEPLVDDEL